MVMRERKPLIVLAFSAIYFFWGSTYLATGISMDTIPPFTMIGIRAVSAGAILYVWGRVRGGSAPPRAQWLGAGVVGAFLFLGGYGGLGWAEQRVPSGTVSLFIATLPLWMALIEAITERDPLLNDSGWVLCARGGLFKARTGAGIVVGMVGTLLLLGPGDILGGVSVDLVAGVVLVLCALSWAVGSALARRDGHTSSLTLAMGTYLLSGGALLLLAGAAAGELSDFDPGSVSGPSVMALAYLIVFGTVAAFSAYVWLLQHTSMAAVSTFAFVNPVVAVFLGWGMGGEALNLRALAAAALVVGAVVLVLSGSSIQSISPRTDYRHDCKTVAWADWATTRRGVRGVRERHGRLGSAADARESGVPHPHAGKGRRSGDLGLLPVGIPGECTGLCG